MDTSASQAELHVRHMHATKSPSRTANAADVGRLRVALFSAAMSTSWPQGRPPICAQAARKRAPASAQSSARAHASTRAPARAPSPARPTGTGRSRVVSS